MMKSKSVRKTKRWPGDALYKIALAGARKKHPDYPKVIAKLQNAIKRGNPDAAYALATWYLWGKEPYIQPDHKAAVRLLRVAVEAGNSDAMWDLAVCYDNGHGVRISVSKAFELYLGAALRGDAPATMEISRRYYWGDGTRRDRRASEIWLERAKELGQTMKMLRLRNR